MNQKLWVGGGERENGRGRERGANFSLPLRNDLRDKHKGLGPLAQDGATGQRAEGRGRRQEDEPRTSPRCAPGPENLPERDHRST